MQPFERWILFRRFLHWRSISQTRGRALRLLRETTIWWRRCAKQQTFLLQSERRARLAIRASRITITLELCLTELAQSRIECAAEIGQWLGTKQPAHVPIAKRLDHLLLYKNKSVRKRESGSENEIQKNAALNPKQLFIQGKPVALSEHGMHGLMTLKRFHWLLSRFIQNGRRSGYIRTAIIPQYTQIEASPIDRLEDHLKYSMKIDCNAFDNPSPIPDIHILDLILLADEIQRALKKSNKSNPGLNVDLIQQHYLATGSEDNHINSLDFAPEPAANHVSFQTSFGNMNALDREAGAGAMSKNIDLDVEEGDFLDFEEGQSFAKYLAQIATIEKDQDVKKEAVQTSLVDVFATSAKTNLSAMKLDVDQSLIHERSSQIHLVNYKEFIEKKRKKRIQCLRDLQTHCCKCRGPHIAKPPFSHGKDYRREPLHGQHQGNKCLFLKKKRIELEWLDETLGKYSKNNERFEREIETRTAETQSRKENMKDALANSLRLMDMASNSF